MLVGKRVTADRHRPLQLPTAFPIDVPLKYDPNHELGAYPHFTDESLRLESHFNSLSLCPKQATPPRLPTNPVLCLPLCRTFPVATATPLGRPALLCIPGIEQAASPHPLRQRDGIYPTHGENWSHWGKNWLSHSDV